MDLTRAQRMTILAAFLGWMLDAFDFFLLTFLLKDIAKEFGVEVPAVSYALFLTLAMRFVGAFIFGRIGDRWGRKPALMLDILCYSILGNLNAVIKRIPHHMQQRIGELFGDRLIQLCTFSAGLEDNLFSSATGEISTTTWPAMCCAVRRSLATGFLPFATRSSGTSMP